MPVLGASGNEIVILGKSTTRQRGVGEPVGTMLHTLEYDLSEVVPNAPTEVASELKSDFTAPINFHLSTSQVESEMATAIANHCSARYGASFSSADVRIVF